ncbi:E3 ubiquitin-protein ligase ZFP91 isoform X2 [Sceloporus undulatus]|uniref:E3 ubiquitin-protein ligase ZFP91 isoform X2 n=1 Tax=Sceloporus undulatus TaxID=8520 RepID=UPI001C4C7248|nr:E3 ubiquitin-protein ligase ZFP91 isoform X2 [Sceloporus undulatus]
MPGASEKAQSHEEEPQQEPLQQPSPSPPPPPEEKGDDKERALPLPGRRRPPPKAQPQEDSGSSSSRVLRGGRERGRAAAAAAAAAASRRRKAEYPRRRCCRRRQSQEPEETPTGPEAEPPPPPAAKKGTPRGTYLDKAAVKDPKEETEEEDISSIITTGTPVSSARPSRGWRSNRATAAIRQCDAENSRSSRSKTGSLQLICKSEPNTDQLEFEITEEHSSPAGIREAPKQRKKTGKGKEEKEKQKEIKVEVEVKEESEFREDEEPPRKRGRRRKDDKSPRLPKRRKKPPIQYVRCEMEGCGTVLAHPRYLQHHIKYQHLLKKKYVCPHPSCGRLFRLQKQLLRHAKHHTDQRDYICEYCARAFKSSHNLAVHRMIHTGEKPLQCEICGFTCRQKASLNWHMKKHDADTFYQFSCNICGKKFEKKDSVVAHKAKSHPEVLIAEALAANAGALITSTDILGTSPESIVQPTDNQGLPLLPDPLGNSTPGECLLLDPDGMPKAYCSGSDRVNLMADGKIFVDSASGENAEGLVMNTEILGATTEVLIEDSDSAGP